MRCAFGVSLAPLTTLGLGGAAAEYVELTDAAELVAALAPTDPQAPPTILLAGGSNIVVPDAGLPGRVMRIATTGLAFRRAGDSIEVTAAAGQSWDDLVGACIAEGLAGLETLTGIPGSVGATPYQNVGAYGREVGEVIDRVRVHDRSSGAAVTFTGAECDFGYRTSRFRRDPGRYVITEVTFHLIRTSQALPVHYPALVETLGCSPGDRPPLPEVVAAVRHLRRARGMLLDPADPDTRSVGSFFVNPVVASGELPAAAPRWPVGVPANVVKTSAAWLIENAGITRGFTSPTAPGVRVSTKHTLALVNVNGTTTALLALANLITDAVRTAFGIDLAVEPRILAVEPKIRA